MIAEVVFTKVDDENEPAGFYWYDAAGGTSYGHHELATVIGDSDTAELHAFKVSLP